MMDPGIIKDGMSWYVQVTETAAGVAAAAAAVAGVNAASCWVR